MLGAGKVKLKIFTRLHSALLCTGTDGIVMAMDSCQRKCWAGGGSGGADSDVRIAALSLA